MSTFVRASNSKARFFRTLQSTGIGRILRTAQNRLSPRVVVLAYHRVLPLHLAGRQDYDEELVSAWQEEFDWQLGYLAANSNVITCEKLASFLNRGVQPPDNTVVITFDDGFADNFSIAFPLLQKHGLKATFFICTEYANEGYRPWFDEIASRVLQQETSLLCVSSINKVIDIGQKDALERVEAVSRFLGLMKSLPNASRVNVCKELLSKTEPWSDVTPNHIHRPMNWREIKLLADNGMEIGSHSMSHPILASINDPVALAFELNESKRQIEMRLGRPVVSFSYPVGKSFSFNDEVVSAVQRAGYKLAVTYEGGAVKVPFLGNPFTLRRASVERYLSRQEFKAILETPGLYFLR
jgi:peptidoglycan/xylan/chitin deacetylase (PgdA/CDA1 family)